MKTKNFLPRRRGGNKTFENRVGLMSFFRPTQILFVFVSSAPPRLRGSKFLISTSLPGTSNPWASISSAFASSSAVGPSAAIFPPSSTMVRAQMSRTISKSWVASNSVVESPSTVRINSRRPRGSRNMLGSSRSKIPGFIASTPARAARRFSPPDNRCGERSSQSINPSNCRLARALATASAGVCPRFSGPKATSSSTVALNS